MAVTIIVPTYNERDNVASLIAAVSRRAPEARLLVVDDNSPDQTAAVVESLKTQFPLVSLLLRNKKDGLGKAYLAAFKKVLDEGDSDAIVMMDADFSHDPAYLPVFLAASQEADVVVGSRYIRGGGTVGWGPWRLFLSTWGNKYARGITGLPIFDCTGGFNLIKTALLRRLNFAAMTMSGYAFQIELKYLLWRAGAHFKEVPIIFKDRVKGESKISNRIIAEGILAPWKIKRKKI